MSRDQQSGPAGKLERVIAAGHEMHNAIVWIHDLLEATSRWPCRECGRPSAMSPFRIIKQETQEGRKWKTGCTLCTTELERKRLYKAAENWRLLTGY